MIHPKKPLLVFLPLLFAASGASASHLDDTGFTRLQAELGAAMPTGAGVNVTQVEAPEGHVDGAPVYAPDPADGQLAGKTITFPDGNPAGTYSGHATAVAQYFYGSASAAPGIAAIGAYEVNAWLTGLQTNRVSPTSSRIANHSWVGDAYNPATGQDGNPILLRYVDRLVYQQQYIQVVGTSNSSGVDEPLLSNGYNVIAVGKTNGDHDQGTMSFTGDSVYVTGRTKPDLVAPADYTSAAAPMVAAAAALLVETGHGGGLGLSHGSVTIGGGVGTVYNAERSETIKAALMAGADRTTANTGVSADITDYGAAGHLTANGLDDRYGAGQLNVYDSYWIIAAGEQESGGTVGGRGFDYNGSFGGLGGSARQAAYGFTAQGDEVLTASLVWNLGVANNGNLTTTLHHLGLSLFDLSTGTTVADSSSFLDNTQNLWIRLFDNHQYEMRVTALDAADFSWGYALAWNITPAPVPLPAALWLFWSALASLGGLSFRLRSGVKKTDA